MNKQRWLWFYVLLGGALAWLSHLMVTYFVGEASCILDGTVFSFLSITSAGWLLLVFTLICLVASLGAMLVTRYLSNPNSSLEKFLKKFGGLANLIFTIAILAQTVPIFTLLGNC